MGVYEGRGQLTKSMKQLLLQWTETRSSWSDHVSLAFEDKFINPMQQDLRNALGAMDHMATLLQQIHHDCE